jgi:hypothetical protein
MMHIVADNAIVESDKRLKSYTLAGIQDLLQLEIIKLGDVEHD